MKKPIIVTFCIITCLGGLLLWWTWNTGGQVSTQEFESEIVKFQSRVDSLYKVNRILETEADSLTNQITLADLKITNLNTKLDDLKNKKSKIPNIVDSIGDDELEQFFTDRYRFNKD